MSIRDDLAAGLAEILTATGIAATLSIPSYPATATLSVAPQDQAESLAPLDLGSEERRTATTWASTAACRAATLAITGTARDLRRGDLLTITGDADLLGQWTVLAAQALYGDQTRLQLEWGSLHAGGKGAVDLKP
jgi:hypothetical protein